MANVNKSEAPQSENLKSQVSEMRPPAGTQELYAVTGHPLPRVCHLLRAIHLRRRKPPGVVQGTWAGKWIVQSESI